MEKYWLFFLFEWYMVTIVSQFVPTRIQTLLAAKLT